jgi:hypothetical protein
LVRRLRRLQAVRGPALSGPLEFLLGGWRGQGVGTASTGDFRYGQELRFTAVPGKPFLAYSSRTWWLAGDQPGRTEGEPLAAEVGWWRSPRPGSVEVMLAHPSGIAEIYVGSVSGGKLDLDGNVLIRTATAREVERFRRLYGLLPTGELGYAIEMALPGQPLRPHLSASLERFEPPQ